MNTVIDVSLVRLILQKDGGERRQLLEVVGGGGHLRVQLLLLVHSTPSDDVLSFGTTLSLMSPFKIIEKSNPCVPLECLGKTDETETP